MQNKIGLYVHVPFCAKKCPYCDFYSVLYSSKKEHDYVDAIIKQMYSYCGSGLYADTLYFGGGTPSLLQPQSVQKIIKAAYDVFRLNGEITLEGNPNSFTAQKAIALKELGINRVSFGMQSAVQKELDALGRSHNNQQVISAVQNAAVAGIENISLDLMLGTPYQTIKSVDESLRFIKKLPITHISAYMLKIEENTPYAKSELINFCADDDLLADIYLHVVETLGEYGFCQYEISNFAKAGYESRHNLKYWQCEDYIGFGAAAHSHIGGERFYQPNDIDSYINNHGDEKIVTEKNADDLEEYVMLKLRLSKGLCFESLEQVYGIAKESVIAAARYYEKNGLCFCSDGTMRLTPKGFLISNSIIVDLLGKIKLH